MIPDVDDTDGLDPDGEFEAWRFRELARIKKEKEEEIRREEEREEIERRRALPEEQRLKEDLERANKLREEKPKGQQKFLQKYWHKGAFHQVGSCGRIFTSYIVIDASTGRRGPQKARLHRSNRIHSRCVSLAKSDAGQELRKAQPNQIHTPLGSRYHCGKRWFWWCRSCQIRWSFYRRWGLLPVRWAASEERYGIHSPRCPLT